MFSKNIIRFLSLSLLIFLPGQGMAGVIYVKETNCQGQGSGTENDPYCSINTAIDVAVDGDEIAVQDGMVYENLDLKGKNIKIIMLSPS